MIFVLALTACATPKQISEQSVNANRSVEDAHNRTLLLNVVRAAHRRPMYFTRVQALKGPLGIGGTGFTLPFPFGSDFRQQIYNFSLQYSPDRPIYDIQVLDTQKFMQGITRPVSSRTMLYYLDQGWPASMILHLLVREIEVFEAKADVPTESFLNYPENPKVFAEFQKQVEKLAECEFVPEESPKITSLGPPIPRESLHDVEKLAAVKTAELVLTPVDATGKNVENEQKATHYRVQRRSPQLSFLLRPKRYPNKELSACAEPGTKTQASSSTEKSAGQQSKTFRAIVERSEAAPMQRSADATGDSYLRFTLRSPEAIVYYLGELARSQFSNSGAAITLGFPRAIASQPLFVLKRGLGNGDAAVSVEYEGITYGIPKDYSVAGRSMHVVSLVTQLLNLQNEGGEVPSTGTVRIINPGSGLADRL